MMLKSLTRTSAISYMHKYKFVVSFVFYKSLLVLIYYHFCVFIYYLFKVIFCKPCCETPFIHTSWLDVILNFCLYSIYFCFVIFVWPALWQLRMLIVPTRTQTVCLSYMEYPSMQDWLLTEQGWCPGGDGGGEMSSLTQPMLPIVLLATHFCCICSFYLCYVCDLSTSAYLCY